MFTSVIVLLLDILHIGVCEEEDPEQERNCSLLQEKPEPPHIKEEQEEPDGSTSTLPAVKSEDGDEDTSSHHTEVEVELESDSEVTEDSDDWEETSGGQSVLNTGTGLMCGGKKLGVGIKYTIKSEEITQKTFFYSSLYTHQF